MKNNPKRVFLKDVAREAGLSLAAVSMAMKGNPSLKPETIKRVQKLAEEMGYFPDPAMSALASHRSQLGNKTLSRVIALVSNHDSGEKWLSSHFGQKLYLSAKQRAAQLGYKLEYFAIHQHFSDSKCLERILKSRGIQSVVLAHEEVFGTEVNLEWDNYFLASIGRPQHLVGIKYVAPDLGINFELLCDHLINSGANRIGCVSDQLGPVALNSTNLCKLCKGRQIPFLGLNPHWDLFSKITKLESWISDNGINGIVGNDSSIYNLLNDAQLFGCSVRSFGSLNASEEDHTVAGTLPHFDFIGQAAIDIVHGRYANNEVGLNGPTVGHNVEGSWQQGNSCKDSTTEQIRSVAIR